MKDSHERKSDSRTQRLPEQEEEEENESEQAFENNNKIYQLQSCINDANIQIQKLQIQLQRERRDYKRSIEALLSQKNSMTEGFNNLIMDNTKLATMHEAEKTSRKRLAATHKILNKIIQSIAQKIGLADQNNIDELQNKIQELITSKLQAEKKLQNLMVSMERMRLQKQQSLRQQKNRFQEAIKHSSSLSKASINSLQRQLYELKLVLQQKEAMIRRLEQQNSTLKRQCECFQEKQAKLAQLVRQNFSQQELIRKYKMKQDLWSVTKQKLNQQKARNQQLIQEFKNKLEYSTKKDELNQQRLKQQQIKTMRLQALLQQCKGQIKKYQERLIYCQQQCEQLKKKIHLCDIYKEKYSRLHSKIKQSEENAQHFVSIADQYADQIQQLQSTVINSEESRQRLQQQREISKKSIQQKQMEIALMSMKLCHLNSAMEEKNKQIHSLKMECVQNNKKLAIQALAHQQPAKRYTGYSQMQIDERNQQIISHFESILLNETKLRREVTNQLTNYKQKVIRLNEELLKMQQQLKEQKQQRQLLLYESKKLSRIRSETHKNHEQKLVKMKQTYRQLQRVNSQNKALYQSKKHSSSINKLQICCCFSYSLGSHSMLSHNKQSAIHQERQLRNLRQSSSSIHHLQILERINSYKHDISSSRTEHKTGEKRHIY